MSSASCLPIGEIFTSIRNLFTKKPTQKVVSSEPALKEINEPVLIVDEKAHADLKSAKTKQDHSNQ